MPLSNIADEEYDTRRVREKSRKRLNQLHDSVGNLRIVKTRRLLVYFQLTVLS